MVPVVSTAHPRMICAAGHLLRPSKGREPTNQLCPRPTIDRGARCSGARPLGPLGLCPQKKYWVGRFSAPGRSQGTSSDTNHTWVSSTHHWYRLYGLRRSRKNLQVWKIFCYVFPHKPFCLGGYILRSICLSSFVLVQNLEIGSIYLPGESLCLAST